MWAFCAAMAMTGKGPFLRGAAVMSVVFAVLLLALPRSVQRRRVTEAQMGGSIRYLVASLSLLVVVLLIEHFL